MKNFMIRNSLIALFLIISGCSAGISGLDRDFSVKNEKIEAIAIIKIDSSSEGAEVTKVRFKKFGLDKDGLYDRFIFTDKDNTSDVVSTADGYFVFKVNVVSDGTANTFDSIYETNKINSNEKLYYSTDCGGEMMAFQIKEPGIHYLGELSYKEEVSPIGEVKLEYKVNYNQTELKQFLAKHHPNINVNNIKKSEIKKYWNRTQCPPGTTYITITI
ncbi:hypothetical protein [Ferrimonas futtsuensis]|uniref:hypothetical protein n=1 Tax=Ferrimonas futtsuensis TaxID=364764 RepID=UPI0012FC8DB0|nr:hypothetical protein [Ferrimonas futtsuensis]